MGKSKTPGVIPDGLTGSGRTVRRTCTALAAMMSPLRPLCFFPGLCHQPQLLQFQAPLTVQPGPMTSFSSRRYSLRKAPIGHFLEGGIDPAKAQTFLDDFFIGDGVRSGSFAAIAGHPAMAGRCMIGHKPLTKLLSTRKIQERFYYHCGISFIALMILPQ